MLAGKQRRNPGRIRAIIYAVLVHGLVIGLAVIGFRWNSTPTTEPVMQAVVVTEQPVRKPAVVDDNRAQEEAAARKREEAEKHRQAELKKKLEEEQTQQRVLVERKKKETETKEKQKRLAEQEHRNEGKQRQKLAEQTLQEQLAAEEKQRKDAAHAARSAGVVDKYKALIKQRVSRSWSRPAGVAKGLVCVVSVGLTSGGEVLSVTVTSSSGNAVFDRSVENAVYKAAPLPLPEDPTLFDNFRKIEFKFNPEE